MDLTCERWCLEDKDGVIKKKGGNEVEKQKSLPNSFARERSFTD